MNNIMVDAHVHCYSCFDMEKFFDAAFDNLGKFAREIGNGKDICRVLMFSEGSSENYFTLFFNFANAGESISRWKMNRTGENCSLKAVSREGDALYIIAGRQIVTAEGLEVLALATNSSIKDGESLADTVKKVEQEGGIPVIPWGFGKWWGRRGQVLNNFLKSAGGRKVFLGDNGGRACFLPQPTLLHWATVQGLKILPGSDPLPFPCEMHRPGSFGFHLEGVLDPDQPASSLRQLIQNTKTDIVPFGSPEKALRFVRNQMGMQLKKRCSKPGGKKR
jgi:hypothetical protein